MFFFGTWGCCVLDLLLQDVVPGAGRRLPHCNVVVGHVILRMVAVRKNMGCSHHARAQVWSGGHDTKVCGIDAQCKTLYNVGALKDNGDVAQTGGTKAIVRRGWNVWVFGMKSITIYMAHCITSEVVNQVRVQCTPHRPRRLRARARLEASGESYLAARLFHKRCYIFLWACLQVHIATGGYSAGES
jgi:hypothetical protein